MALPQIMSMKPYPMADGETRPHPKGPSALHCRPAPAPPGPLMWRRATGLRDRHLSLPARTMTGRTGRGRGGYPCRWHGSARGEPTGDSPPPSPSGPFHHCLQVTIGAAIFLPAELHPLSPPAPAAPSAIFAAGSRPRALPGRSPGYCGPVRRLSVKTVRLKELSRLLRGWGSDMLRRCDRALLCGRGAQARWGGGGGGGVLLARLPAASW